MRACREDGILHGNTPCDELGVQRELRDLRSGSVQCVSTSVWMFFRSSLARPITCWRRTPDRNLFIHILSYSPVGEGLQTETLLQQAVGLQESTGTTLYTCGTPASAGSQVFHSESFGTDNAYCISVLPALTTNFNTPSCRCYTLEPTTLTILFQLEDAIHRSCSNST